MNRIALCQGFATLTLLKMGSYIVAQQCVGSGTIA